MLTDELWDKYSYEWVDWGQHNLAYVVMLAGPENFPNLYLDHSEDDDFRPFYDEVDEVLRELFIRWASQKDTPLDNHDYYLIARRQLHTRRTLQPRGLEEVPDLDAEGAGYLGERRYRRLAPAVFEGPQRLS
jgi:hypothetical protein